MGRNIKHLPPFSDTLIPFLTSILQEKSNEAYFSRAWASEGTVFALPLEYMLRWPCQRCVSAVRHALWGPRHRPGPSACNYRNHQWIGTDWPMDGTSESMEKIYFGMDLAIKTKEL